MRGHFSLIVFLSQGDIEDGKLSPHLGDNGTIKYRDLDPAGKSLVVIELVGDVDEHTWWQWRSSPKILAGAAWKGKFAASPVVVGVAGSLPAALCQRAPVVGGSAGAQWRSAAAGGGGVARCTPAMRDGVEAERCVGSLASLRRCDLPHQFLLHQSSLPPALGAVPRSSGSDGRGASGRGCGAAAGLQLDETTPWWQATPLRRPDRRRCGAAADRRM